MRLLFLVEGKRTEKGLYHKWVQYLLPGLNYSDDFRNLEDNQYAIISGNGCPGYYRIIESAYKDISEGMSIDHLFICVDSEDQSIDEKRNEINEYIQNSELAIDIPVNIIIQNHCVETWLLGNRSVQICDNHCRELLTYQDHYNVNIDDPENMERIDERSIGKFTYHYLQLLMRENGLRYSKKNLRHVDTLDYFEELKNRYTEMNHIGSFGILLTTISSLNN